MRELYGYRDHVRWIAGMLLLIATCVTAPVPVAAAAASGPVLERRVIGHSVQGRPIIAYRLGDPRAARTAIVLGQMHGDEPAGPRVINALLGGRGRIAGIDLWVIRTMNPDGRAAGTRQNARGVDLNRNFPASGVR